MRPPWKRGSSWVDQNPPTRVYRRRVAHDAAAGTANTGPDHRAAPAPVDPPPPASNNTGRANRAAPAPVDPPLPPSSNTGPDHRAAPAPVDPPPPASNNTGRAHRAAPAPVEPPLPPSSNTGPAHRAAPAPVDPPPPPSDKELSWSTPGSSNPPLRGAAGPSVGQLPPSPDKEAPAWTPPSDPSPHGAPSPAASTTCCSTDAATTPRRREIWRPKQKTPEDVVPPRQSPPDVAAAATPQAHAAFPTGITSSAPPRRGTPSSTPSPETAHRGTPSPSPPPSAPARRVTPPLPSSGSASRSDYSSTSSSSSGATRSGTRSTASSSSTSSKSYAGLLQDPRSRKADLKLRGKFSDFLKEFTIGSAKAAYYKAQVAALKLQESFKLEIQFEHLLARSLDMAIDICKKKERASEFIRPVVCQFLFEEKLSDNRNEIIEKIEVSILSMPSSMKYISEFIADNAEKLVTTEILAGNVRECIATDIGMMLVQRSAAEVFRGHRLDLTWGGDFGLKDMVLINDEEVRIIKPPMPGGSAKKVKDVNRIGLLFMPFFRKDGKMALYFNILEDDLRNVSENDVTEEWFIEYTLGHPGLRPSMIRYNLLDGAHQSCKKFCVAGSMIKKFLDQSPSWCEDWRSLIPTNTADAFYKIYWYNSQPGDGICQPFEPTNRGILSFKRHFTRHADIYLNVQDLSEVEKIGARKFQDALPDILKQLLRDCHMHKKQPLLVHWKPYRDARLGRDGHYHRDGVIGVYPAFW